MKTETTEFTKQPAPPQLVSTPLPERVNPPGDITGAVQYLRQDCVAWKPTPPGESDIRASIEARVCDAVLGQSPTTRSDIWAGISLGLAVGVLMLLIVVLIQLRSKRLRKQP